MKISLSVIPKEQYHLIDIAINEAFLNGEKKLPAYIKTKEDVSTITYFLEDIFGAGEWLAEIINETDPHKNDPAREPKIIKSIQTIASNEQINKLIGAAKTTTGANRLKQYIYASNMTKSDEDRTKIYNMSKFHYNQHRKVLNSRIARVKDSPKAKPLIDEYPQLPIEKIIKLGILRNKIELENDDMEFLKQILDLILK